MEKEIFLSNLGHAKANPRQKKEIWEAAGEKFDNNEQVLYLCVEEFSEITKEITKYLRGKGDRDHILEELAHAQIAVRQLQTVFGVGDRELAAAVQASLRGFYPKDYQKE